MNIQGLREEHDEALNAVKDNGATEFVEELDKLHQILEEKKVMLMIQKKDNDILYLPDKHLSVFYHEAKGFRTSIGNVKH